MTAIDEMKCPLTQTSRFEISGQRSGYAMLKLHYRGLSYEAEVSLILTTRSRQNLDLKLRKSLSAYLTFDPRTISTEGSTFVMVGLGAACHWGLERLTKEH